MKASSLEVSRKKERGNIVEGVAVLDCVTCIRWSLDSCIGRDSSWKGRDQLIASLFDDCFERSAPCSWSDFSSLLNVCAADVQDETASHSSSRSLGALYRFLNPGIKLHIARTGGAHPSQHP